MTETAKVAPSSTTRTRHRQPNPDKKPPLSIEISRKLDHAFLMARWFMMVFGKFPFKTRRKYDGTYTYEIPPFYYPQALWFYFITIWSVICTCFLSYELLRAYFTNDADDYLRDRCKRSWESTMFTRHFNVIMFFLTTTFTSAFTGIHIWVFRKNVLHFMNYWSNMMQKIQFDCTQGLKSRTLFLYITITILTTLMITLYATDNLLPVEETAGFFMRSLLFTQDLYAFNTPGGVMTVAKFNAYSETCFQCRNCTKESVAEYCLKNCLHVHNNPSIEYKVAKGMGFFILLFLFFSSLGTHVLFMFFCRCLINTSEAWNIRFSTGLSTDRHEDITDEFRRRITPKTLILDFGLLVELYQMTEEIFGFNLALFYLLLMTNIISELYYFALMTTQRTCKEWISSNINLNYLRYKGRDCDNWGDVMHTSAQNELVSFEDPCHDYVALRLQQGWVCVFLFMWVMLMFVSSIWEGHQAVHVGLQGFQRLRKYNYMSTRDLSEIYFVHTVKLVYLGPCAIHISAANFFVVRKKLFIIMLGSVFVYLLMLVGFHPGQIRPARTCRIDDKFAIKYPRMTGYN